MDFLLPKRDFLLLKQEFDVLDIDFMLPKREYDVLDVDFLLPKRDFLLLKLDLYVPGRMDGVAAMIHDRNREYLMAAVRYRIII